ncbi:hypothetical protein, partial [Actinobacillus pleuropneumoniae]
VGQPLTIINMSFLESLTNYDSDSIHWDYYMEWLRLDPSMPSPIKRNLVLKVEAPENTGE